MRLTADELQELKEGEHTHIWRFAKPKNCAMGQAYTTAGEIFTVLTVQHLERSEVWQKHRKVYDEHNGHALTVLGAWLVLVGKGDQTDQPRFLAHAGFGDARGYAKRQVITKTGKRTTMTDEPAVSDDVLVQFAKAADPAIVAKQTKRHLRQRARTRLRDAKKALDALLEGVV